MHVNDAKMCTCTKFKWAACIGDWCRVNLCKGLKVPLCFIPLMQILFPHYMNINNIYIKTKRCYTMLVAIKMIKYTYRII